MLAKICFAYIWATSGGVERVFLNRGEALLRRYSKLTIDVYFYNDCGGLLPFIQYISTRGLGERFRVVTTFNPASYDAVFAVDTPQVLLEHPSLEDRIYMECHTPYAEQRKYLHELQTILKRLIVPSATFVPVLEAECPKLRGKIGVIRNFVPCVTKPDQTLELPLWTRPAFLHLARIDDKKNVAEFLEGIAYVRRDGAAAPIGIICGPIVSGYPLQDLIAKNRVEASMIVLPPIPFESCNLLLSQMRHRQGIFVSCSKGESFGLSAAEAMTAGLPVILSDIPPHVDLVQGDSRFIYKLGNVPELAGKMKKAMEHYDQYATECLRLSQRFSEDVFIEDWERFVDCHPAVDITNAETIKSRAGGAS